MTNITPISVTYTDSKLRILIEEFIAMLRSQFTFRELCSYILYCAMEEGRTTTTGLYESNQLADDDCERVSSILEKIVREEQIEETICGDNSSYLKK